MIKRTFQFQSYDYGDADIENDFKIRWSSFMFMFYLLIMLIL
jgi:hypothetical protein